MKTIHLLMILATILLSSEARSQSVDFGREVRPILAKHCVTCHGPDPDAREADLRLDTQQGSRVDLGGYQPIKPRHPHESEVIQRITSDDSDVRMPPADKRPPLSASEIEILKRWIAEGALYDQHWAFVPAKSTEPPKIESDSWSRGPIDSFVLQKLRQNKLGPSQRADKVTLVRRLYLDLLGVTPPVEVVDEFASNHHPAAYQKLVDRLLASPQYAERFARPWLDLARYSDTNGYEKDRPRTIWPYRDWVIQAIAADMPFDQFTVEQLAGDMLPSATQQQKIATGFHRNTMLNEEGGIDPLEYRFYAMVDRVATTGTVWMGLTIGCAQCHTHKYDPITHTDYYSLMALLNNADEPELDTANDEVRAARRSLEKQADREALRIANRVLESDNPKLKSAQTAFAKWKREQIESSSRWKILRPIKMESDTPRLQLTDTGSILASGDVTKREVYNLEMPPLDEDDPITALRLEVLPHDSLPASGPGMAYYEGRRGDFFLSKVSVVSDGQNVPLRDGSVSYGKISVGSGSATAANVIDEDNSTGWSTSEQPGKPNRLVLNFEKPFSPTRPWRIELLFERHFVAALGHFRIAVTSGSGGAKASEHNHELEAELFQVQTANTPLDSKTLNRLKVRFVQTSDEFKTERKALNRFRDRQSQQVRTLVMKERHPDDARSTHRHHRGEYLQPKELVPPAVPSLFAPIDGQQDRLALARWLASDRNPLVGRVVVNRAWREFFGTGIVRTAGDFGTQSEPPSHPRLIDYLDQAFRDGWSMKRLHREIVLSATYQQQVLEPPSSDPDNRLLSCFPYRRLDAERIRDAMLSAADLLTNQVGGPSVYPPQPSSVTDIAYGKTNWKVSSGANRYRRSLYTFSKRTAPFAAFTTFDAPSGELCVARRDSSTTPLQALTLMNDEMYIEIARGIAESVLRSMGPNAEPRSLASLMFRQLFTRSATEKELESLLMFVESQRDHDEPWTLLARALMNTDEAITSP